MPSPSTVTWDIPAEFAAAVNTIKKTKPRPDVILTEIPPPTTTVAPYSFALAADVSPAHHGTESNMGTGRFILLYDETQPEAWGGPFRIVCFAQAPLETEISLDPFIAEVTWSWLIDALNTRDSRFTAASGTATKIISTGFGELTPQGEGAQIELRASWTPLDSDMGTYIESWAELLCMLAGLPPQDRGENVSLFSVQRTKRG